jgi:oligoribonuclease NrnB/cAMP/cGMP phosphodiesterase (DHH superfamily)
MGAKANMTTPIPKPWQVNLVLYHRDLDGFASAWAAWKRLGDKAEYIDVQYGEDPPDVTGRNVAIVDFHYPRKTQLELLEKADSMVILDHHSTTQEILGGIPNLECNPDVAGVIMSWEWFHAGTPPPFAALLVQDYDLWTWQTNPDPDLPTREFVWGTTDIPWKPEHFEEFNKVVIDDFEKTMQRGRVLCSFIDNKIESATRKAVLVDVHPLGIRAWMYNGHHPWYSELGNAMCQKGEGTDIALIWTYIGEAGKFACSLRSPHGGTNVANLAKKLGGGGHVNAAAFAWKGTMDELFTRVNS